MKNKQSVTVEAESGVTSPGLLPGTGSILPMPETTRRRIYCGIVHNDPRSVPGIFEDTP
jgi:hypothetical protein